MVKWKFELGAFALLALVFVSIMVCHIYVWKESIQLPELQNAFLKKSVSALKIPLNPAPTVTVDRNTIRVMIASEGGRLVGMIAAIHSIISNTVLPVLFYLVTSREDAPSLRTWILESKLKGISFVIRSLTEDKFMDKNIKLARLYIPLLFPEIKGMLIYIDDDCIIQGDIKHLAELKPQNGHYGIFSSDCNSVSKRFSISPNTYSSYINFNNRRIKALQMSPGACSFNTGVFVVNMTEWKLNNITERLLYWANLNANETLGSHLVNEGAQPPIMIVFYHKITNLEPLWNVRHLGITSGSRYSSRFLKHAKLLHWDGPFKPWSRRSSHTAFWEHYYIPDPTGKFRLIRRKPILSVK